MNCDTISAIATANGIGSIAIIRISGDRALDIAKKLSRKEDFSPRYATLTNIYNSKGELIDESIVIFFKAPFSFTAEDVVEIQCHGGFIVAQSILRATLAHGARLATAGEFSKRAFFNGRIDLSEAEAIAQLIEAKSEDAAKILAKQMKGSLKEYIEKIRDDIIHILAYSEVSIDYAEEDLPEDLVLQIEAKLDALKKSLEKTLLASRAREGLMQGFRVAIIGKPNVGKSSLLNALLNYNRAIVSDIAGTTRDTIEEQVKIGTHLIRIVDTAGIREANDEIERIGIERSIEAIKESDIVIALFDGSRVADSEDEQIISLINSDAKDKHILHVKNKIDLEPKFVHADIKFDIELNSKESVDELIGSLENIMNTTNSSDEMMLISQRQISAVENTLKLIDEALFPLQDQELEIFSFHLNEAVKEMASITRPFENDEMLDKMFGSFCLGK
ncbi:MAG: tRNA uridine-5-carboxymethylaminomethyl(34) synthesis GTPase MnmE [Sulfurimonas sp. RIFCSPHIGHO2_12_FULL_36_9]|nr:MAG: tRNA uridine-5-carboxymethylaminomethyl(34) synthesis GTPase MnmE [Sulfuricurvum sp. RIFCSPLOWO2_02_43_6]OHD96588.1 MAG: tRNA uridine-5-carboxymethylaminomethyl(34) synthesis GTPase MnmE [Sulfurimonas sp. RIFCSPHIGHO2_12_FULL_36_9]OHE02500.1 MAG: tRNA uridine-5-carboxymethylaminomethyl(34) synthesis GTPase MnmE [Sulfurimonas sp. RIFCSPLOWO2_12_36_12]OHE06634.1 MAG: tRNA uridine-5-carboxymethylaminomethyl(34) synthesis GTPase MnmE [Sulfurimonas sp. RIFCSPLOWO2_12_FULL_36_74]